MDLYAAILAFPTVVFTVLLGVALVYWLLVVAGALGLEFGDLDLAADGLGGLLGALGFGRVPTTIVLSLLFFFGWIACLALVAALAALGLVGWLPATLALGGAIVVGSSATSLAVRPLAPLFVVHQGPRHAELVGRECTVTTGRVDESFGQASVIVGGVDVILQVRCPAPNPLARHHKALLVAYDPTPGVFAVEALDAPPDPPPRAT